MNWAAIISFLHPLLTVIITSGIVLYILKKDYSAAVTNAKKGLENVQEDMKREVK